MKLIDKVKPEILDALKESKITYSSSYELIITSMSKIEKYRDLTINQVDNLILFLPEELKPNGRTDFYYGDYLLQKQYQI
tara:strand:+ start:593 stop:832 length:240 start_codon:yes stop_codon:yes gene_type:complete